MSPSWSIAELLLLARLSDVEYTVDRPALEAGVKALGLDFLDQVGTDERQALVAFWPARQRPIVCFQGTRVTADTDAAEIGDDLELDRLAAPNGVGFVHRGFFAPVAAIWDRVLAALPKGHAPIFTGHSLGGVSAHFGPAFMAGDVVSFGAPKGADAAFWASIYPNGESPTRIVHEEDFAPGWNPLLGWTVQPAGDIGWIHAGRLYRVPARTTWLNESVADHDPDKYVAMLSAIAASSAVREAA